MRVIPSPAPPTGGGRRCLKMTRGCEFVVDRGPHLFCRAECRRSRLSALLGALLSRSENLSGVPSGCAPARWRVDGGHIVAASGE